MKNSLDPWLCRMNSIRINIEPLPHNSNKESHRPTSSPIKRESEELDLSLININPSPKAVVRGTGQVGIILMGCWLLRTRSTSLPRVSLGRVVVWYKSGADEGTDK